MRTATILTKGTFLLAAAVALLAGPARAQKDAAKVLGPNACAECHKYEAEVWKGTHHFATFLEMPRRDKARTIADKMGVRRIKTESLCTNCHFTNQGKGGQTDAIAGISCESCHSAGADWSKLHSEFSGKKKETESPAEAEARWAKSEAAGMIRPGNIYALAKNCLSCHVVPNEKLVNVGEHPAGSAFELLAWSQGEVRHNLWYSGGKENRLADAKRKRQMYVVGVCVELEVALRAVGKATERAPYAVAMARRAAAARAQATALAKSLGDVPELAQIAAAANAAGLKLNNDSELSATADAIAAAARQIAAKYDGSTFGAIDAMLPGPDKFKGAAASPSRKP